jgi:hypothetical protein
MKRPLHLDDIQPNRASLRTQVSMALGRASVCWSEPSPGVFDSETAAELSDDVMLLVERCMDADGVHISKSRDELQHLLSAANALIGKLKEEVKQARNETRAAMLRRLVREFSEPIEDVAEDAPMATYSPGLRPADFPINLREPGMVRVTVTSEDGMHNVVGILPNGKFTIFLDDPES